MDHFDYRDGILCVEDIPIARIAEQVGTPFYCYSTATMKRHYQAFESAFDRALGSQKTMICYAVKANSNIAVISTMASLGAGADVVSGGEIKRVLAAGISPDKIVFSGVGKTREELSTALKMGIFQINVESVPELEEINKIAGALSIKAPIVIRVNPDVDANTHQKITTGKGDNKFGIDWQTVPELYALASKMPGIEIKGIAIHIGSQLVEPGPFRAAFTKVRDLTKTLRADGLTVERLDIGGGLGIAYSDDDNVTSPADYANMARDQLGDLDCRIILEPGRAIVGNAGILVCRVIYVKKGAKRTFIIVDAAMNDLMRPALYNAEHAIIPVKQPTNECQLVAVDVVGPVCESGDTFATQTPLPPLAADDLLAFRTAGAYGSVMASSYNSRPLIAEVMAHGKQFSVIRKRINIDDLIARESIPDWINHQ